jgi:serine/threonine-protein kinase
VPSAEPASAPVSVSAPLPPLPSSESDELTASGVPSGVVGADDPVARRKGNRWLIVAATVLVVVPLVAIGVWLAMKPSGQSQPRASAAATTPPSTPGLSDDQARLLGLVPPGYPPGACTPATPGPGGEWANAVAVVSCGQNTQPGGPSQATYGLFPNPDNLKKTFDGQISNVSLVNCPGEGASPAGWHYDQTPNVIVGLIACGMNNSRPNVVWTTNDKLMLGDVSGDSTTVEDLHKWWASYG